MPWCRELVDRSSRLSLEDLEQFGERDQLLVRRINDRPPLLKVRLGPVFVLKSHAPVRADVDNDGVHRLDVQPHHTPAAAAARWASSTPRTMVAVAAPSDPPPYAYSTLTLASLTSFSVGASAPGLLGTAVTITSRSVTWW